MLKSICRRFPFPQPPAAASAPMIDADCGLGASALTSVFHGFGASNSPASVLVVVAPTDVVVVVVVSQWQSMHVVPGAGHGVVSSHSSVFGSRRPSPHVAVAAVKRTART